MKVKSDKLLTSVWLGFGWDERKPNNDLLNQEKNQCRTIYKMGINRNFIYPRDGSRNDRTSKKKGKQKSAQMPINRWGWKLITAACLKRTNLGGKWKWVMAACLKWLNRAKNIKISKSEIKRNYDYWAYMLRYYNPNCITVSSPWLVMAIWCQGLNGER